MKILSWLEYLFGKGKKVVVLTKEKRLEKGRVISPSWVDDEYIPFQYIKTASGKIILIQTLRKIPLYEEYEEKEKT